MKENIHRFWVPLAVLGLTALVTVGMITMAAWAGQLSAAETVAAQIAAPHISVGIEPRLQEFFAGGNASFTVAVTNTGNVAITGVSTASAELSGCARNNLGSLQPGQTTTYTCGQNGVTESFLEVITATGSVSAVAISNKIDAFVQVKNQDLTIIKLPQNRVVRRGETARFTIVIFNNRPTPVTNVRVIDSGMPNCTLDPELPLSLGTGENNSFDYPCTVPNVQGPVTGVARFEAEDPADNSLYTASDAAWVDLLDLQAQITAQPATIPEPGGAVSFTVRVTNSGSTPLTLDALSSTQFGDLLDDTNVQVPAATNGCLSGTQAALAPSGGAFICEFLAQVSGPPSRFAVNLLAVANHRATESVTANSETGVQITNVIPDLAVNLTAEPPLVIPPGGPVEITVRLANQSESDTLTIDELNETTLGDLDGVGDCAVPITNLGAGEAYECSFSTAVTGQIGDSRVFTVNAAGFDDDPTPNVVSASGSITVPVVESPEKLFLPQVIDTVVEPNDRCSRAFPLFTDAEQFFRPPGTFPPDEDWFEFSLAESGRVSVEVFDFAPLEGQLLVYRGPCNSLGFLGQDAPLPPGRLTRFVDLGIQPSGRYFVRILNDGPPMSNRLYGLIVNTD